MHTPLIAHNTNIAPETVRCRFGQFQNIHLRAEPDIYGRTMNVSDNYSSSKALQRMRLRLCH